MTYSTVMFDQVAKAIANPENWDVEMKIIWEFVDSDVFAFFRPEDPFEHYRQFDAACQAIEAARGEPYPRSND